MTEKYDNMKKSLYNNKVPLQLNEFLLLSLMVYGQNYCGTAPQL